MEEISMGKPFNLNVVDTKDQIAKVINESGLPITMLSSILRDMYNELVAVEKQVIEQERQSFEQQKEEK
jgi:hypothetical protein